MSAIVMVSLFALYAALGTDRTFVPNSWQPSGLWVGSMLLVGFVAAIVGGEIAMAIGGRSAVNGLMGLVLALSVLMIAMTLGSPAPAEPRPAEVTGTDAMMKAQTPIWVAIANALIGAGGVRLAVSRRRAAASPAATDSEPAAPPTE